MFPQEDWAVSNLAALMKCIIFFTSRHMNSLVCFYLHAISNEIKIKLSWRDVKSYSINFLWNGSWGTWGYFYPTHKTKSLVVLLCCGIKFPLQSANIWIISTLYFHDLSVIVKLKYLTRLNNLSANVADILSDGIM